jgi:hypothetical protein
MRDKARLRKVLDRQREAESYMIGVFRQTEEQHGIPVVLFHAYADAIDRYGLQEWRPGDDRKTAGETMARTQGLYQDMVEAMGAYTLEGGSDRWRAFDDAVCNYGGYALVGVEVAQAALYGSDVEFSEATDPAFAGLVELDE